MDSFFICEKIDNICAKDNYNDTDICIIDFNSVISDIFYLEKKQIPFTTDDQKIDLICERIQDIYNITNPKSMLYVVFDGVSPYAKMKYLKSKNYKSFDYSGTKMNEYNIGTEFMKRVEREIKSFLENKLSYSGTKPQIKISDHLTPGDGSHKIISYLNTLEGKKCFIYSSNQEIVFRSLRYEKIEIDVLAYNRYNLKNLKNSKDLKNFKYITIKILNLKNKILRRSSISEIDHSRFIDDVIFIFTFVGNDVLPSMNCFSIHINGYSILIKKYIEQFEGKYIIENGKINTDQLQKFFNVFTKNNAENKIYVKKKGILKSIRITMFGENDERATNYERIYLGTEEGKIEFFNKKLKLEFNDENIKKVSLNYLKGLHWIAQYYFDGSKEWDYHYEYDFAPFFCDLELYAHETFEFEKEQKIEPLVQLIMILPRESIDLLSKKYLEMNKYMFLKSQAEVDFFERVFFWDTTIRFPSFQRKEVIDLYNRIQVIQNNY